MGALIAGLQATALEAESKSEGIRRVRIGSRVDGREGLFDLGLCYLMRRGVFITKYR